MRKLAIFLFFLLLVTPAFAQDEEKPDNTGTNPINFTNDLRIYHNYSELNTLGDGKTNTTTMEFHTPFANGKWQFRIRVPYVYKEADTTNNGVDNINDNGLGNVNIRFINASYFNKEETFAIATGLEVFFDTANDPAIAGNSTSLGPQIFAVFFKPPGGGALVAPAYQHVFSVDGVDVNRSQYDIFYLWTFPKSFLNWVLVNPQGIVDYENNDDSWNIDLEAGKMLTKHQSVYLRPGVGIGSDRAFDWDMEVGWKMVW